MGDHMYVDIEGDTWNWIEMTLIIRGFLFDVKWDEKNACLWIRKRLKNNKWSTIDSMFIGATESYKSYVAEKAIFGE